MIVFDWERETLSLIRLSSTNTFSSFLFLLVDFLFDLVSLLAFPFLLLTDPLFPVLGLFDSCFPTRLKISLCPDSDLVSG